MAGNLGIYTAVGAHMGPSCFACAERTGYILMDYMKVCRTVM